VRLNVGTVVVLALFAFRGASAYEEWDLPNLTAPTSLPHPSLELHIQHQFSDSLVSPDVLNRFLGLGDLANVVVGLRADVWSTAQVYASFSNTQMLMSTHWEYTVGGAYAVALPWISMRTQLDAEFFSYAAFDGKNTRTNAGFFNLSLANDPLFGRVVFLGNVGYDSDQERFGLGIGVNVTVLDMLDVFADYFPMVDKAPRSYAYDNAPWIHNPYCFGLKFTTSGHQFFFFAGNSTEVGARHLMQGAIDDAPRFGFMITRLFRFD
jgi:hypothetical protein